MCLGLFMHKLGVVFRDNYTDIHYYTRLEPRAI